MRYKVLATLALACVVLMGFTASASAQSDGCASASPSKNACKPAVTVTSPPSTVAPAMVLSESVTAPAASNQVESAAAASPLAFTGSDAGQLALIGAAALGLGLVLRSRARARTSG